MKKRIMTILMTFALIMSFTSPAAFASTGSISELLNDKDVYYTEESDYIAGDCVLTATRMMIRRAAIMNDASEWADITNETLRPEATMDGLLLYSFTFSDQGLKYKVSCGSFKGEGNDARIGEFEELLRKHPEGIVVHGENAASSGTHGVLVTGVKNGVVYAMDASYNMGMFSEGIQKWDDTTMLEPCLVTDYWYISEISGSVTEPVEEFADLHNFNLLRHDITCV